MVERRVAVTIAGTVTLAAVGWRLWRHFGIPLESTEAELAFTTATPHMLDDYVFAGERQPQFIHDGVGPLFHRRYYVDIADVEFSSKAELMKHIVNHLNQFTANTMALFRRIEDDTDVVEMSLGDDYFIHIAGPFQAPVRVIDVSDTSFSFITLDEHLEAGEIQFRLIDHPEDADVTRFEIRSWSRSGTRLVDLLYDFVPVTKIAQARIWIFFCQRVVEVSGGRAVDEVQIDTHRIPEHRLRAQMSQQTERWQQYYPNIERLRRAGVNYELDSREDATEIGGWHVDDYAVELPPEDPGPPQPEGSWEQAQRVLQNYEFPDPNLITGIFAPEDALEERVMLLKARFLIFEFQFGVRISKVIDEQRETDDGEIAQVWGYSYQTLEGHFEMGEITFTVWKFLESGNVEFRIHAYSKTGHIDNLLYRLGFALFGRRLQVYFSKSALERTQELVTERLADKS